MRGVIYIEGGGDGKDLRTRARQGFRGLFERARFEGRMPKLVACGSRNDTFDHWKTALSQAAPDAFVAVLVDSEDPVEDVDKPWQHLKTRDGWIRPEGVDDDQALLMVTCMETWIVADREALREHYTRGHLQDSALPSLRGLESRCRQEVQEALAHATRTSPKQYSKGKRSFEVLSKVDPSKLEEHLSSFKRCMEILKKRLG